MSSGSEAVLYDIYGDPMAVEVDTAIPAGTATLVIGGSDGTNARFIRVDSDGYQMVMGSGTAGFPSSGVITIQGVVGGINVPISGTVTANAGSGNFAVVQATASNLLASVGGLGAAGAAPVGNPVLIGGSDGTNTRTIRTATDGTVRVDPTGTTTQPISGTVTANAGSGTFTVAGTVTANIGTPGALALDATLAKLTIAPNTAIGSNTLAMVGGHVTTVSPTYTNGNINPLSLTTAGALRVDGSNVVQPVSINAGNNNIGDVDVATIAGVADSGNSSTSTLGSGATFTGTAFDTLNFPTAVVIVKSDVASATNGLKFQWSGDGTNWDVESGSEVLANGGRGFHVSHRGRYFRIQYVNGGSAQTFFRLNVIHRPSTVGIITRPLDDNIDDKNFAQITRSVLTAKTPGGSYVNINANNGGNLKTTNDSAYNEDTVHNTGDMGTFVLGVRNDSASSLTNANGDYSPFATDSAGRLGVSDLGGSITVDGTVITVGAAADGAPPSGNPVLIAGQDGTNVQTLKTDTVGRIEVAVTGTQPSFYAVFDRITLATNKYLATLFNTSSTRKVVIQRIWVYNWQSGAVVGANGDSVLWRITARTAGTTVTPRAEDSNDTLSAGISADTNSTVVTQDHLIMRIIHSGDETNLANANWVNAPVFANHALRYERKSGNRGITLRQNQGISLQWITGDADGTWSIVYEFTDEAS